MPHPPDLRRGTCVELVRPSYARAGAGIAMSSGTATGPGHGGDMSTPVAAHRLSADDGRRFFVRSNCETHILGIAYNDLDVVEVLPRAGDRMSPARTEPGRPQRVRRRGGPRSHGRPISYGGGVDDLRGAAQAGQQGGARRPVRDGGAQRGDDLDPSCAQQSVGHGCVLCSGEPDADVGRSGPAREQPVGGQSLGPRVFPRSSFGHGQLVRAQTAAMRPHRPNPGFHAEASSAGFPRTGGFHD